MSEKRLAASSRFVAAVALMLGLGIIASTLPIRAQESVPAKTDEPKPAESKADTLDKSLIGAWVLEKAEAESNPSGIGKRLKFFTGTHWMVTQPGPNGVTIFHHGGTYKIDGDTVITEHDFAGENTASLIGRPVKLKITVEGDTLKQTGLDNPYTETWKRAK